MSKKMRMASLLLCVALCMSLCVPAFATNTKSDVEFSVSLDQETLTRSDSAQTVKATLKLSKSTTVGCASFKVVVDSSLSIPESPLSAGNFDLVDWNANAQTVSVVMNSQKTIDTIATVDVTVPANTPEGEYNITFANVLVADDDDEDGWASGVTATATLTITDSTPASTYTAGISSTTTSVEKDDNVAVSIKASSGTEGAKYTAAEMILTYDKDKLTFVSVSDGTATYTTASSNVKVADGVVTFEDYGQEKDLKDGIYTVNFTAAASGDAKVTLTSAKLSDKAGAAAKDLTSATISQGEVTVHVKNVYSVSYPNQSYISGNTTVTEGNDYTLTVDKATYAYYTYTVSAKMGNEDTDVTDNGDGTYTVGTVTGNLAFTVTRTAKQYDVTFTSTTDVAAPSGAAAKATYGTDYTFTIPDVEHYTVNVTSIKYAGGSDVTYSSASGVVTIKGTDITDDFTVTLDKVQADATVTVEGNAASDATGYTAYATPGTAYTLTVNKDSKYDYTVTATLGGTKVDVTDNKDGTYTIAGTDVTVGAIVFKVDKALKTDKVSVEEYLTLNGTSMWLIRNEVAKETGSVYQYKNYNMFWSDAYEAYCYLVIAESKPTVSAADLDLVTGTATEISGNDVNKTGTVDANDAQLIYNMYNAVYSDFTEVSVEKFLLADTNGDKTVDTKDAVVVINAILNSGT